MFFPFSQNLAEAMIPNTIFRIWVVWRRTSTTWSWSRIDCGGCDDAAEAEEVEIVALEVEEIWWWGLEKGSWSQARELEISLSV